MQVIVRAFAIVILGICACLNSALSLAGTIQTTTTKIDVSTANSSDNGKSYAAAIGGNFMVSYNTLQPTGTGVIQPFLRIQQTGQERGFNTDFNAHDILDDKAGIWTHSIQVRDFATVEIGGVSYLKFLLDVNQANGNAPISLNQVQIFLSSEDPGDRFTLDEASSATRKNNDVTPGTEAILHLNSTVPNAEEVFRINVPELSTTSYEIIGAGGHGSGSGDLFLYVEADIFGSAPQNTYVTMFSQFGAPPGINRSSAGFEEWSFLDDPQGPVPVPEPMSLGIWALLGLVGAFAGRKKLRRPAGSAELLPC